MPWPWPGCVSEHNDKAKAANTAQLPKPEIKPIARKPDNAMTDYKCQEPASETDPLGLLEERVRAHLRQMQIPTKKRGLYPALHSVASAIDWGDRAKVIGMVFRVVCNAVDAPYGSQYMSNVLLARFDDGTMARAMRAL